MPAPYGASHAMTTAPDQPNPADYDDAVVVQDTVRWLERAVIGLNLCPFAKGVHTKDQIHYAVSHATDARALAEELQTTAAGRLRLFMHCDSGHLAVARNVLTASVSC